MVKHFLLCFGFSPPCLLSVSSTIFQFSFAFISKFPSLLCCTLPSLRDVREKNLAFSFFLSFFFLLTYIIDLYKLFSYVTSPFFCDLFSSAVKRSVDFKSRGVKLFPGKDSGNKFSICEFTFNVTFLANGLTCDGFVWL